MSALTRTLGFLVLLVVGSAVHAHEGAVITVQSQYSFEETVAFVKDALQEHSFQVLKQDDHGQDRHRYAAIYFCNFGALQKAVAKDKRIGAMLPCQITITQSGGQVFLSAPNPHYLAERWGISVGDFCDRMKAQLIDVLMQAAT